MSEGDTTSDALPDRWTTRDLPVLRETARRIDATGEPLQPPEIAPVVGLESDEVAAAFVALVRAGYLDGRPIGSYNEPPSALITGVTERGMRTVGIWPSGEGVDALVEALRQAEEATDDPEEQTMIRRAGAAVGGVSRAVMTDVLAAFISRQVGGV